MTTLNESDATNPPAGRFRAHFSPSRWAETFTALREPEYAWYFVGNIAFFMAMQMQIIVRGFIAYDLTGKATSLAFISVAMAVPMVICSPFGGLVADRFNKRTLLIVTQSSAAVASLVVAILIIADLIQVWHLAAISLVTGALFAFNMPARQALVPSLVPQQKLMNAVSLQMGGMNLTRIIAPAAGGLLIGPMGAGWVYMLTTVLFSLAALSELKLPKHGMNASANIARKPFREEFTVGFRYIAGDRTLRLLVFTAMLMPLFAFPLQQLQPVFAQDVFGDGTSEGAALRLGLLSAAIGVGGLVGAIASATMDKRPAKGRIMLAGASAMAVTLALFAWVPWLWLALVILAAMGVGQMVFQATNNTAIQSGLPPEVRGRVMAVLMMSFGIMPLGVIPTSLAADAFGAPAAVGMAAAILFAVLGAIWLFAPALRNLRVEAPEDAQLSPVQAAAMVAQGRLTQEEADRLTGETRRRELAASRGR